MLFWVVMSGFFDLIHITMGIFTVTGVIAFHYKLKAHRFFSDDMNDMKELRYFMAVKYFFWMIIQILQSGFHVLWVIANPSLPTKLSVVRFKVDLPSAHAKMILGNSITLTPGTVTVDLVGDQFTVHALDESSYAGIVSDEMPRQVLQLFEKEDRQVISDVVISTKEYSHT